jgi:hypothetical protein
VRVQTDTAVQKPEAATPAAREVLSAAPSATAGPVRRSLRVGAVDDPYEREADRVASEVVARLRSGAPGVEEPAEVRRSTRLQAPVLRGPSPAVSVGHQSGPHTIRRLPYEATYSGSDVKSILMASDKRLSPVTKGQGHPIQHVGRGEKAERFAREEGKNKSVFASQDELFAAAKEILADSKAQSELRAAEATPTTPKRIALKGISISEVNTWVARISKKRGEDVVPARKESSTLATMIVDTMGDGTDKGIHVQTVYPQDSG